MKNVVSLLILVALSTSLASAQIFHADFDDGTAQGIVATQPVDIRSSTDLGTANSWTAGDDGGLYLDNDNDNLELGGLTVGQNFILEGTFRASSEVTARTPTIAMLDPMTNGSG